MVYKVDTAKGVVVGDALSNGRSVWNRSSCCRPARSSKPASLTKAFGPVGARLAGVREGMDAKLRLQQTIPYHLAT